MRNYFIQNLQVRHQLKEWGQMESDTVQTVVASNFMRSYKSKVK